MRHRRGKTSFAPLRNWQIEYKTTPPRRTFAGNFFAFFKFCLKSDFKQILSIKMIRSYMRSCVRVALFINHLNIQKTKSGVNYPAQTDYFLLFVPQQCSCAPKTCSKTMLCTAGRETSINARKLANAARCFLKSGECIEETSFLNSCILASCSL